ncbi:signal transducer and activator of transcription 1-like isoform X2 [Dreissena polymorpha]|uniref:signal transducer and activator of transcription 1-like isoform X2 n=1 Tax=Dreissena polymorpha TaxID=45954 RepID=UPI002265259E|nr:signal transducer and activator of transcription 1-like isoform X2 [Dreissena polymorpha]
MGSPGQCTSILEFLHQHEGEQIASEVYFKWKDMLPDTGFDEQFRTSYDRWFQFCYRNDLNKFSNGMVAQEKTRMFDELKKMLNHEQKLYLQYIENKFGGGEGVVDAAFRCLWREEQMLIPYIQSVLDDASSINRQEHVEKKVRDSYETCLANYEKLKTVLAATLAWTEEETQNSITAAGYKNKIEGLSQRLPHIENKGLAEQLVKRLQEKCNELESANQKLRDQISLKQQESLQLFDVLLQSLIDNNGQILDAVTGWRNQFKMFYAEVGSKPDIEKIAKCCAETAKLLYDIKQDGLAELTHPLSEENCQIKTKLDDLLLELFGGTFIVVEQDNYVIKKESQNLKIIVRVLAADQVEHMLDGHIQAFLFHEESLNQCCEKINDTKWLLNVDRVEHKSLKLVTKKKGNAKGAESRFIRNKKTKYLEGEFSGLQVEKFDRAGLQRQVHEERYKIVFMTNVGQVKLWTLSLPLVMITGSNQQCHSLASVMWACYSTNVYTLPSVVPTEMTLRDIVDCMLDAKIRKLCPSRGLSDDSKEHLKRRLIGSGNFTDESQVSLQQFCFDKMFNTSDSQPLTFSFWEWFVACYNLIEKYLLPYWERGWIFGFISKTTAAERLQAEERCRDGLFILRFSDSIIVPSQGVKSMFGHLTVCFTYEKVTPGGETKRGIFPDGNVADYKELDRNCLANILSETLRKQEQGSTHCYRYVYPSLERREDTFDKFLESKPVVANYQGVQQMWLIDIEQMLSCKKDRQLPYQVC